MYLIETGEVLLAKNLSFPQVISNKKLTTTTKQVAITTLEGVGIVGEDCLDGDGKYKYTISVKSSDVKAFVFEKSNNVADFQSFPLFSILLKGYHAKE